MKRYLKEKIKIIIRLAFIQIWMLLIIQAIYAQSDTLVIATLNGYCGGGITKEEVFDDPEIVLNSNFTDLKIEKIGFYSNTKENLLELWNKGGKLNSQMIDRIQSLENGDEIYFDIYVQNADTSFLIHPLEFKISNDKVNKCPCFVSGSAMIKETAHGKLSKQELLKEGKLTIISNNKDIKLIDYKAISIVKGYKKEIACYNLEFNSSVKQLINSSVKSQRIYFSNIKVSVNNRCYYLTPVEIQIE